MGKSASGHLQGGGAGSDGREPAAWPCQRRGGGGPHEHRLPGLRQGEGHRLPAGELLELPGPGAALLPPTGWRSSPWARCCARACGTGRWACTTSTSPWWSSRSPPGKPGWTPWKRLWPSSVSGERRGSLVQTADRGYSRHPRALWGSPDGSGLGNRLRRDAAGPGDRSLGAERPAGPPLSQHPEGGAASLPDALFGRPRALGAGSSDPSLLPGRPCSALPLSHPGSAPVAPFLAPAHQKKPSRFSAGGLSCAFEGVTSSTP